MREETLLTKLAPVITIVATVITMFLYVILTGTPINGWISLLLLGAGFIVGLGEGQMTRLYYRGPVIVGKRSAGYLIIWGLAFLFTTLMSQTGVAALYASAVLTMAFGLGVALGSNANLLFRRSRLQRPAAPLPPPGAPPPAAHPRDLPGQGAAPKRAKPKDLPR
jgi:hypothetical protein